jgi:hypothetical protein
MNIFSPRCLETNIMNQIDLSGIQISSDVLESLTKSAYDALADGKVTFGEVVTLGGVLAGKVNQIVQLSGHQKQAVVMGVVERGLQMVLQEKLSALPEDQREAYRQKIESACDFVKGTLPSVLTLAVQASRGEINLGKIVETVETVASEDGPLSCLRVVLPVFQCIRRVQAETPAKLASSVQLEMKSVVGDQFSKETPDPPTEEEPKSQEIREPSTASQ